MKRDLLARAGSWLHSLCGALMALGAVGHSGMTGPRIEKALSTSTLNAELQHLLMVVWHFGGASMVLLGGLVMLAARKPGLRPAALAIALAYTAFGLWAWAWSRMPFFAVFTALGLALLAGVRLSCQAIERGDPSGRR